MKILVVDDELDVKPLFMQRFRKEIKQGDIEIHFANSGEEALIYLNDKLSEVVLILSDVNMPGMSGLELLYSIRHKHQYSPPFIMMITAYGDEDNRKRSFELGADDFLTKPLDFVLLKEKLKELDV
ncbi:response regulator [Olivibacter sitiensis]|uniref:response regulator n=1 Tax=Olivibacter sitiensis TaxID=376470 RepID=UPI0004096EF3|nr:response regulator [Olivibacter sitiensis]